MDGVVGRLLAWGGSSSCFFGVPGCRPDGAKTPRRPGDGHADTCGKRARKQGPATGPGYANDQGRSQAQCGARAGSIARLVVGARIAAAAKGKRVGSSNRTPASLTEDAFPRLANSVRAP